MHPGQIGTLTASIAPVGSFDATADELAKSGVCVARGACNEGVCAACLLEVLAALDRMLSLPASMNATACDRHFVRFATSLEANVVEAPAHRRDFIVPLAPWVRAVLNAALAGQLGEVLTHVLGREAQLSELTAITSEPGAAEQAFHSDTNWNATDARRLTVFIALHDLLDEALGPTSFVPRTHAPHCFPDDRWLPPTTARFAGHHAIWFALRAGDAILFDPCTWHRGGANASIAGERRTLLAVTFVEPAALGGDISAGTLWLRDFVGPCGDP